MLTGYLLLKWLHVVAAAVLVGSFVSDAMLIRRVRAGVSPETHRTIWSHLAHGEAVAIPTAVVLLASGLGMIWGPWSGAWSFTEDLWTSGGLVFWLVAMGLMGGLAGSAMKQLSKGEGDTAALTRRVEVAMVVVGVALVGVLYLMVVKPF